MTETAAHTIPINAIPATETVARTGVLKVYYQLIKPGITRMVVLTTTAGYFLGVPNTADHFSDLSRFLQFLLTVVGTALICAGSCAMNNIIERKYDKLMKRTAGRGLPSGEISLFGSTMLAGGLSLAGAVVLSFVNIPTLMLALATLVIYTVIYTPMKRKSEWSLLVGAIPGALPPLGGWTAATGEISVSGIILFMILFFWQLPHFLSLSWIYKTDYLRGGYKMLATRDVSGKKVALQALLYTTLLFPFTFALYFTGAVGPLYALSSVVLGGAFITVCYRFLKTSTHQTARTVLLTSYAFLTGVVMFMFIDKI